MNKDIERFMRKVEKGDSPNDCWRWIAASVPRGYGRFYLHGKPRYAHRVSLFLFRGQWVRGDLLVLHSCDNPACVNPDHLSVGTQTENMRDASRKGRTVRVQDWRGTRNPKAKLTDSQKAELLEAARNGIANRTLAEKYGITITRVQQLVAKTKKDGGGWAVETF